MSATYDELGISRQRVAEWRELRDAGEHVIDEAIQAALDEGRAPTHTDVHRAVKARHHRTRFTGENEWYTPAEYVEAARTCLGSIDLDPATSPVARSKPSRQAASSPATTTACATIGADASGSTRRTRNRTSRASLTSCSPRSPARATQAILLTHNYTDTGWFHAAAGKSAAICFTRGRIRFVNATGEIAAPTQGQAFFYFGAGTDRFRNTFGGFGFIR